MSTFSAATIYLGRQPPLSSGQAGNIKYVGMLFDL
jgi:hypothetical protein